METLTRKFAKNILKKHAIIPRNANIKSIINNVNDLLINAIQHFKQDFRHQLENHVHIFGIYDFVNFDNDFHSYITDLLEIILSNIPLHVFNLDFLHKISNELINEIIKFIQIYISEEFYYKIDNVENIPDNIFDINKFNYPNGYVDKYVLVPLEIKNPENLQYNINH